MRTTCLHRRKPTQPRVGRHFSLEWFPRYRESGRRSRYWSRHGPRREVWSLIDQRQRGGICTDLLQTGLRSCGCAAGSRTRRTPRRPCLTRPEPEVRSRQPARRRSTRVVYVALAGNLAIAVAKLIVFAVSKSSAILAEPIHSFVDSVDQIRLLVGE